MWIVFFALLAIAVLLIVLLLVRRKREKIRYIEDEKQEIKRDSFANLNRKLP